ATRYAGPLERRPRLVCIPGRGRIGGSSTRHLAGFAEWIVCNFYAAMFPSSPGGSCGGDASGELSFGERWCPSSPVCWAESDAASCDHVCSLDRGEPEGVAAVCGDDLRQRVS